MDRWIDDNLVTVTDNRSADATSSEIEPVQYAVLSRRVILWASAVVVLLGVGATVGLLLAFGSGDAQQRNQLDAVRTAGTIVIGAGGGAALLLAGAAATKHRDPL